MLSPIVSTEEGHYQIVKTYWKTVFWTIEGEFKQNWIEDLRIYLQADTVIFSNSHVIFVNKITDAEYEIISPRKELPPSSKT